MKKTLFALATITLVILSSCKGKKQGTTTTTTTEQAPLDNTTSTGTATGTKTATTMLTPTPDSGVLGKKSELVIKVKNFTMMQLTDPDGKITGTELTYDIQATNRNAMGDGSITIDPSKYRLELDNGTKISHEGYNSFNVDAEATASSSDNKFKLDPGVKPVALDLFYDETRAVIKLTVK